VAVGEHDVGAALLALGGLGAARRTEAARGGGEPFEQIEADRVARPRFDVRRVERLDYSAELEKTAYHRWFAGLFEGFVAALDRGDPGAAAGPFLEDIRRVASVVEHAYVAARNGTTVAIADGA